MSYHNPVLYEETLKQLNVKPMGVYVDGTSGGGGHSEGILKCLSEKGFLICIDRDTQAVEETKRRLSRIEGKEKSFITIKGNYSDMQSILMSLNIKKVDGIVLDLGVSSHQLDDGSRGFGYSNDADLDMRMDTTNGINAAYIVNNYDKKELSSIIFKYGEEKWASRITDFILKERETKEILTTVRLADIIKNAIPASARREGPHPARRTFQALRIAVNDELGHLGNAMKDLPDLLNKSGKLCVITFHSLEDRIVKNAFRKLENPCTCPSGFPICVCNKKPILKVITRKPIAPSREEEEINRRSRSAKLRVAEKI